jgi:hypothetical protein
MHTAMLPNGLNMATIVIYEISWFGVLFSHSIALYVVSFHITSGQRKLPTVKKNVLMCILLASIVAPAIAVSSTFKMRCGEDFQGACVQTVIEIFDILWACCLLFPVLQFVFLYVRLKRLRKDSAAVPYDPNMENKASFHIGCHHRRHVL